MDVMQHNSCSMTSAPKGFVVLQSKGICMFSSPTLEALTDHFSSKKAQYKRVLTGVGPLHHAKDTTRKGQAGLDLITHVNCDNRFSGFLDEFKARGPPDVNDTRIWAQLMRVQAVTGMREIQ
eukprot:1159441-Pelagomonas_calceolata.AAC.4